MSYLRLLLSLLLLSTIHNATAEQLWNNNSFTYLQGSHYELGDAKRKVITFEHASGHTWGDMFLFVDRLRSSNGSNETYMEVSPRYSLGDYLLDPNEHSFVKDILLSYTMESGQNDVVSFDHHLYGFGIDLNIPYYKFFKLNFYRRNNDGRANNWQMTHAFAIPFSVGEHRFLYDGFIDWSSAAETTHSSLNFTSQLKWDVGQLMQLPKDRLFLGIEYVYWRDKFGVKNRPTIDSNEDNLNLLIKAHF